MSSLGRALAGLAVAGLVVGLLAAALTLTSDHVEDTGLSLALGLFIGWSFIGTGLYAWWRRPASRIGALMAGVGFAYFLQSLTAANAPALYTAGLLVALLHAVVFAHMVLAYPDGRLEDALQRRLVAGLYVLASIGSLPFLLFGDPQQGRCDCPVSILLVEEDPGLFQALDGVMSVIGVAALWAVLAILVRRWTAASGPRRRALAPLLWSGIVLIDLFALQLISATAGLASVRSVADLAGTIVFAATPWVFLLALLRSHVARAGAVTDLLARLGDDSATSRLRDLLADALGDPGLEVAFWLEEDGRWVGPEGRPATLPADRDPLRTWTSVNLEGRRVGALVHDRSLCEDPGLLRSVATAAGLAVERERLEAQLRARVEDLHTSRARLLDAGVAERRRLERNLHDGAQQRLVALSLALRLVQARVEGGDPGAAARLLEDAQHELRLAQEELRELARGIHPAVLSDRGLDAALEALRGRSPVPVRIAELPPERLPAPVEAAAYFVVAEALTNVAKYAGASVATVRVARENGSALVEVADDGVGGADPARGSGLRGLADRLSALDGRLVVESPPGEGTRLRAELPV